MSKGKGTFRLQLDEDEYRIVAPDGTEGPLVEYGDLADIEHEGKRYVAFVVDPDDFESRDNVIGMKVYAVEEVASEVEEVEILTGEGGDEEDEEDEEDEDEENEPEP